MIKGRRSGRKSCKKFNWERESEKVEEEEEM